MTGILQRKGEVIANVIPDTKRGTLHTEITKNVTPGSEVFTDALPSYGGLAPEYLYQVVDHAVEYVNGQVHTNGIENFWSLWKRCIKGTHIHIDPDHVFRYLDEETFRFNNRTDTDSVRFTKSLSGIVGKRLTYKELIGKID